MKEINDKMKTAGSLNDLIFGKLMESANMMECKPLPECSSEGCTNEADDYIGPDAYCPGCYDHYHGLHLLVLDDEPEILEEWHYKHPRGQ